MPWVSKAMSEIFSCDCACERGVAGRDFVVARHSGSNQTVCCRARQLTANASREREARSQTEAAHQQTERSLPEQKGYERVSRTNFNRRPGIEARSRATEALYAGAGGREASRRTARKASAAGPPLGPYAGRARFGTGVHDSVDATLARRLRIRCTSRETRAAQGGISPG